MENKLTLGKTRYISEGLHFIELGEEKNYSFGKTVHSQVLVIIDYILKDNHTSVLEKNAQEKAKEIIKAVNMHDKLITALTELIDFAKNTVNHSDYINNYDDYSKKEDMKIIEKAVNLLKQTEQK